MPDKCKIFLIVAAHSYPNPFIKKKKNLLLKVLKLIDENWLFFKF